MDELERILAETEIELLALPLIDDEDILSLVVHQEQRIEILATAFDRIKARLHKRLRLVK